MDSLGEDLVLLSIRPENGLLATVQRIDFGLMGSELRRLDAIATAARTAVTTDR
jgi:hypothetical protein